MENQVSIDSFDIACIYKYIKKKIHMCIYIYVYIYIYMYGYMYIYIHVWIYVYIYMYVFIYLFIYPSILRTTSNHTGDICVGNVGSPPTATAGTSRKQTGAVHGSSPACKSDFRNHSKECVSSTIGPIGCRE